MQATASLLDSTPSPTEVEQDGKRFLLRDELKGTCGGVIQAAGVALPPTVQQLCLAGRQARRYA